MEVIARVQSGSASIVRNPSNRQCSELDPEKYLATLQDNNLDLTAVEFQLLKILVDKPGRIYTRD